MSKTHTFGCPECFKGNTVRAVSRIQLEILARDAGRELEAWPAVSAPGYWWCFACSNGGALFRWSTVKRGA